MRAGYSIVFSILRFFCALVYPLKYIGRENIPEGAAVVCANHSDAIDPLLVAFALGRRTYPRFMAKIELRRIPIIGWILEKAGVFFVDRSVADINSAREAMRLLKSGEKVMLFPEGRRVAKDESADVKTGAIRFAARVSVPILPVYVPREKRFFRRTTIVIGKPYALDVSRPSREESEALANELMAKIAALSNAGSVSEINSCGV